MTDLIIVDGEAWLPEEWEKRERQLASDRDRYQANPRRREQVKAAVKRWRERNPDKVRSYESRRPRPVLVGSLHELACTGPTRAMGCVCRKIHCYDLARG